MNLSDSLKYFIPSTPIWFSIKRISPIYHNKMKAAEMIELLQRLDKEGKISGVIDDRGKFIYISREEMQKVAAFINRKGRVSIEDIARESNKLINLNTTSNK